MRKPFIKLNKNGYSMLEVVLVMAVLTILMGFAVPSLRAYARNGREAERADHEKLVQRAVNQYFAYMGWYPDLDGMDGDDGPRELSQAQADSLRDKLKSVTSVRINTDIYEYTYDEGKGTVELAGP